MAALPSAPVLPMRDSSDTTFDPPAGPAVSPEGAEATRTRHPSDHLAVEAPRKRRRWPWILAALLVLGLLGAGGWVGAALGFAYSSGERVGVVQKLSHKGWVCKTWEGELAMSSVPGAVPEKFLFTVRSDSLARAIEATNGQRVVLTYGQHKGVPTSCFGDTQYYVTGVRPSR